MALVPELVAHAHSEVHNTLHLLYALDCEKNKEEKSYLSAWKDCIQLFISQKKVLLLSNSKRA